MSRLGNLKCKQSDAWCEPKLKVDVRMTHGCCRCLKCIVVAPVHRLLPGYIQCNHTLPKITFSPGASCWNRPNCNYISSVLSVTTATIIAASSQDSYMHRNTCSCTTSVMET